jgi:transcriptional regulator with XRE-family HTH domain
MPRIAAPPTQDAVRARKALKTYLTKEQLSANALAGITGVGQSTLCRFLTGRTKSVTASIKPVLRYAHIEIDSGIANGMNPLDNGRVRDALARAWDGSPESAELLAGLIEALGPVVTRHFAKPR